MAPRSLVRIPRLSIAMPLRAAALALAILAPASCSRPSAPAAATVNLAPKFRPGETTTFEHEQRVIQSLEVQFVGAETLIGDVTRRFTMRVLEVRPDGGARVEMRLTRLAVHVEPPRVAVWDFDSNRPDSENPSDARARLLRRMLEIPILLSLDRTGAVESLGGDEAVTEALAAEPAARDMHSLFHESWWRSVAHDVWGVGEGASAREIGSEWTYTAPATVGGMLNGAVTMHCRLAGVETAVAGVECEGAIAPGDLEPLIPGSTPEVREQSSRKRILWDVAEGRLQEQEWADSITIAQSGDLGAAKVLSTIGSLKRIETDPAKPPEKQ